MQPYIKYKIALSISVMFTFTILNIIHDRDLFSYLLSIIVFPLIVYVVSTLLIKRNNG